MATDDKTKKPNAAAEAPKPEAAEELPVDLQLLEFWDKNKKRVIGAACIALAGVSVYSAGTWWIESQRAKQGLALSLAQDAKDFQRVASEFRGENVGAYALLLLADDLYQKGKYEDSAKAYQRFLDEYSKHPLAGSALYGKGAARESLGDYQGAINAYQAVVNQYGTDIHVADARMAVGRCEESLGNALKARQAYEDLIASFPNSSWAAQAGMRLTILDREARAKGLSTPPPAVPGVKLPAPSGGIQLLPPKAPAAPGK